MTDQPTVFDEIDWNPKPMLNPGVDFHDHTTYFTLPLIRTIQVPPKKKGLPPTLKKETQTYVVSSEREGIWYDEEALDAHGFVPNPMYIQETENRWSRTSVRAFLEGTTHGPSTKDLFLRLRQVYTDFVEFADEAYHDLMPLFIMYTYTFRLFESTGYIHFNGTAASGKSRNLSILDALAFNTIWASSMSAAALYRKLAGSPGTTCIDESEGFDGERGEDLRRIMNAGYRDGSKVSRVEKINDNRFGVVEFDTFGPKALASINALDNVIGSRCMIVAMRPAIRQLPDFQNKDPRWATLRDELYLWAMENTDSLAALADTWLDSTPEGKKAHYAPKLIGRQWEITAQYIILGDYVGGTPLVEALVNFFNGYFATSQEALDATDRLRTTLRCLPRVLATKTAHPNHMYSVKDIHEVIVEYMETDSTEYFKTKHVTKNLDVLGFKHKVRAAGGLRIQLEESAVRAEFQQRRVQPFEQDEGWLDGKITYQSATTLFDAPTPITALPWWNDDGPEVPE